MILKILRYEKASAIHLYVVLYALRYSYYFFIYLNNIFNKSDLIINNYSYVDCYCVFFEYMTAK